LLLSFNYFRNQLLENIQNIIILLGGTLILAGSASFVVFSVLQYRKAKRVHELEIDNILNISEKETYQARLEATNAALDFVSQEIHDNVGQMLSTARLNMHVLVKGMEDKEKIDKVRIPLNEAITGIREISHLLSKNQLKTNNLPELINSQIALLRESSGASFKFENGLEEEQFNIGAKPLFVVYRMFQEILNNSIRHSEADRIHVSLKALGKNYILEISDDGRGFDLDMKKKHGNGLQNLFSRAQAINAELNIQSILEKGTTTKIIIPKV